MAKLLFTIISLISVGALGTVFANTDFDGGPTPAKPRAKEVRPGPKTARLLPPDAENRISGLQFNNQELEIKNTGPSQGSRDYVVIEGSYPRADWGLIWKSKHIVREADGGFKLSVAASKSVSLELFAVGPRGEVETEKVRLFVSQSSATSRVADAMKDRGVVPKPVRFSAGLGFSSIGYKETDKPNFSEMAVTGKVSYSNVLAPPRWNYGVSAYMTLMAVTSNPDATARFLGVNLRVGYVVPSIAEPWRLTLFGGWYYTTMMVSTNEFGFENMSGPQLYPVIRRVFSKGDSVVAYAKYSPVQKSFNVSFANRELAAGGAYIFLLKNGHPFSVTLDASLMHLEIENSKTALISTVDTTSISIGASYGF